MIDANFLTLEEARDFLQRAGFKRSFVWVKTMVQVKKIASELRYGRRVVSIAELQRVLKKKPKLAVVISSVVFCFLLSGVCQAEPVAGFASYYTVASCQREGTSGVFTATGERYNEKAMTCAHPVAKFGTMLRVENPVTGAEIVCRVNDRGPNMNLYRAGRLVDLTPAGFKKLFGTLRRGTGRVIVEEIKHV